jgi:hypothetical protein
LPCQLGHSTSLSIKWSNNGSYLASLTPLSETISEWYKEIAQC